MKTTETIFSLSDTLARALAFSLWGDAATEEDVSDLGLRLALLLDMQVNYSRENEPLLALSGEPVYTLDHFANAAQWIILNLSHSQRYGEWVLPALYEGEDRITRALIVLHLMTGLLTLPDTAALLGQIWPARLQTFVAHQN